MLKILQVGSQRNAAHPTDHIGINHLRLAIEDIYVILLILQTVFRGTIYGAASRIATLSARLRLSQERIDNLIYFR